MPMTKRKLGLLLLSVAVVAVLLSGCFLFPKSEDTTPPQLSVTPTNLTVPSGGNVHFLASASDNSGIQKIVAEFDGTSTTVSGSNSVVFDFAAPTVTNQTNMFATVTAYDNSKNHNENRALVEVTVLPTEGTNVTYGVKQSNPNGLYVYPAATQQNGSVLLSVYIMDGANLVHGVSVFVDGISIQSTSNVNVLKVDEVSTQSTTTQAEYTFFYPITSKTAGPHTYYVEIYGSNNRKLEKSPNGYFYITYPSAQKVELSATPVKNGKYLTGEISFVATATDYTSKYEAFIVNGKTSTVLVDYPSTDILNTLSATKIVEKSYKFDINTASMTDGPATFVFKDVSVDGVATEATVNCIIDNTPPVLTASYKGEAASNGKKLYVGISPSQFDVYMKDANIDSYDATIMNASQTLPVTLSNGATVPVYVGNIAPNDGDTATFTAWAKDKAEHKSMLTLTIVRDLVKPTITSATVTGLAAVGGVPYSASTTITVEASVTDSNLKSVAFVLDGPNYTFPLTKNASGLWTAEVDLAASNVLPGTYKASIIATDLALNEATAATVPATVNVYRSLTSVFKTSLETSPSTPVNGFVKSATITVNINPDWVYAVKNVYLYKGTTVATSQTGTASDTYYFTSFSSTGTYHVVVEDNVAATTTQAEPAWTVKIDSTKPSALSISPSATVVKGSPKFTVSATDTESGVAYFELQYKDPDSTWVTIDSTSGNNLKEATFTWYNLQTLLDGKYTLKLIAKDGVGNEATKVTDVVNDSMGAPHVTFTPAATLVFTNKATQTVGFTVSNEGDINATLTFSKPSSTVEATHTTYSPTSTYPYEATWKYPFDTPNATYTFAATVMDEAGNKATHTAIFVYDTNAAIFDVSTTPQSTVAGATPVVFTIEATDELSGISAVEIYDPFAKATTTAKVESGYSTGTYGQITHGTYIATLTSPSTLTSGPWYPIITVVDNAGNAATATKPLYVDVTAPTITVQIVSKNATETITNGASETNYVAQPATFTWLITTDSGTTASVAGTISGLATTTITTVSGTMTVSASGQYVITIVATNPINNKVETFTATKTVVIDNTPPTALLSVPATLSISNFDTAVATYTATDANFKAATLTINGHSLAVGQASVSTPLTVALNNSVFDLASIDGTTVTATLTVVDKALNSTTVHRSFYVDTVAPAMSVNKTLYKSGGSYYLDIQFSEYMKDATITNLASTDVLFDVNGVYYYLDTNATQANSYVNDMGKGLLHISQLLTTSGATTNVLPLAGNKVTITLNSAKFIDFVGNKLTENSTTVTFKNVSSPNPVNP